VFKGYSKTDKCVAEKRKRGGRFQAKKLQQLSESTFSKREELLKTSNEHN